MKRLPLTFEERQFFKAVEKTAVVLLIMFRIYPVPINTDTLAYEMKWDARTAEKYLESLASDNLTLLVKGQGYVLTGETRRLIAQFFGKIVTAQFEAPALALPNDQAPEQDPGLAEVHTMCALEEVEGSDLKIQDSPSTSKSAQNVLSVELVLGATPILFGDPGVLTAGLALSAISADVALGWVAQAYDQRQTAMKPRGLRSPAGLIHSRLADHQKPRPQTKYLLRPCDFLPNTYLEKLGLAVFRCRDCGQEFARQAEIDAHVDAEHASEPDLDETAGAPDETVMARFDGRMSAEQAWQEVLRLLEMEMPKASFNTWVRDTRALHYEDGVLTIGTMNIYARDWLESRLASTVSRLLVGIMNSNVTIKFVVTATDEDEHSDE